MEVYKYIGSGIVAWLLSVGLSFAQSSSPQELVDSFKSLHDNRDLENILILFETKDAAPIAVDSITEVLSHEFENNATIDKVAIQEIDREQLEKMSNGYHYNGKLLVPNSSQFNAYDESNFFEPRLEGYRTIVRSPFWKN